MKNILFLFCNIMGVSLVLWSASIQAESIYIAQTSQGTGDGTSAANARAVSWFNSSGNWGSGTGKISARRHGAPVRHHHHFVISAGIRYFGCAHHHPLREQRQIKPAGRDADQRYQLDHTVRIPGV